MVKYILLFILLTSLNFTSAQWVQTNGPQAGFINDFLIKEDNGNSLIFAAAESDLYLSSDNGNTWVRKSINNDPSLRYNRIYSNGNTIYLCTLKGIYYSNDNGNSWTILGLANLCINCLTIKSPYMLAGTPYGMYRSVNDGVTWTKLSYPGEYRINDLKVINNNFYAATEYNLIMSTDAGQTWQVKLEGTGDIHVIQFNGIDIFAGTSNNVKASSDYGNTWRTLNLGISFSVEYIFVNGSEIYLSGHEGFLRSTDNGISWSHEISGLPQVYIGSIILKNDKLFIGSYYGIFNSTDKGLNWRNSSNGFYNSTVRTFARIDNKLFTSVTFQLGLFVTTDNGSDWQIVDSTYTHNWLNPLISHGNDLYGGAAPNVSTDYGKTWTPIYVGPSDAITTCLAFQAETLFAATGAYGYGIFRSTDYGHNWECVGLSFAFNINSLSVVGNYILTATTSGLYISNDSGRNWELRNSDYFFCTAGYDNIFYAGGYGKISISTDAGATWNERILPCSFVNALLTFNNLVFAGTDSGVFVSSDNGTTWNDISEGLIKKHVLSFHLYNDTLYAGTYTSGVWKRALSSIVPVELTAFTGQRINNKIHLQWETVTETNNRGFDVERKSDNQWIRIAFIQGNGTSTKSHQYYFDDESPVYSSEVIYRLKQIDYDGSYLYSKEVTLPKLLPFSFNLEQNYPNPFNPVTIITWSIPEAAVVELKLYDILGKEISTLINNYKEAGTYKTEFDASTLPSGVYFYTLNSGGKKETRKLILLK